MATDPRLARLAQRTAAQPSQNADQVPPVASISDIKSASISPAPQTLVAVDSAPSTDPAPSDPYTLKYCTVCASNNNRSMEAHKRLSLADIPVVSFGTGSQVRLPGPSMSQPQVYHFNTTSYATMFNELEAKDERLYRYNGCLPMLERNKGLKWGPERFQDWVVGAPRLMQEARGDKGAAGAEGGAVDVIFTCEERCWDAVVDNLLDRGAPLNKPVHVFNIDIRDNHEEALVGGEAILELAEALNQAASDERRKAGAEGWDNGAGDSRRGFDERVPDILAAWQERWPKLPALWTLSWL